MKAMVVGAGLAGCSAAFTLRRAGYEVKLLEKYDEVGGRANTVSRAGYLIDTGCSTIATSYTSYLALANEAGVADWVAPASPYLSLIRDRQLYELNANSIVWSGARTNLLSLRAKMSLIKLFRDVFSARRQGMLNYNDLSKASPIDNETVLAYAMRRLNKEISDYFCDPVTRVMLLSNPDRVSKVEFFSGVANILDSSMGSMRGGQQRFAKHLVVDIPTAYHCDVTSVNDYGDGVEVTWSSPSGTTSERADACVVACPINTAAQICPQFRTLLQPLNTQMRYTKAITVSIGASILVPSRSFMVLVPSCEQGRIGTLFLEHNKCADRAPEGHSLLVAMLESQTTEACWNASDQELVEQTLEYLYELFPSLKGKVDMTYVKRWEIALPLMDVGGYQHVAELNESIDPQGRVQFAGDYLSGAGQNTAVNFGVRAARNIIANRIINN